MVKNTTQILGYGPTMPFAYDAFRGRARDQEEEGDDRIARARTFLQNRLSREDFQRFSAILSGEDEGAGYDPDYDPAAQRSPDGGLTRRGGTDQPPRFRGEPLVGGGRADERAELLPGTGPNIPERNLRETEGGRDRRQAHDARPGGYFDAFPANALVSVSDYGR